MHNNWKNSCKYIRFARLSHFSQIHVFTIQCIHHSFFYKPYVFFLTAEADANSGEPLVKPQQQHANNVNIVTSSRKLPRPSTPQNLKVAEQTRTGSVVLTWQPSVIVGEDDKRKGGENIGKSTTCNICFMHSTWTQPFSFINRCEIFFSLSNLRERSTKRKNTSAKSSNRRSYFENCLQVTILQKSTILKTLYTPQNALNDWVIR